MALRWPEETSRRRGLWIPLARSWTSWCGSATDLGLAAWGDGAAGWDEDGIRFGRIEDVSWEFS